MNDIRDLNIDKSSKSKNANTSIMFIELYLVVLAFFILLNALSKIDEVKKVHAVDSIRKHFFNYDINIETIGAEYEQPTGISYLPSEFIIQHYSDIRLERLDFIRLGNLLLSRHDVNAFFEPNSTTVLDSHLEWLDNLAGILVDDSDTVNYRLDMFIGSHTFLRQDKAFSATGPILDTERLAIIANILLGLGIHESDIRIGITKDHPGEIRFLLSIKTEERNDYRQ